MRAVVIAALLLVGCSSKADPPLSASAQAWLDRQNGEHGCHIIPPRNNLVCFHPDMPTGLGWHWPSEVERHDSQGGDG